MSPYNGSSKGELFRVEKAYQAAYSDPLIAKKNERLVFEHKKSEWPGWIWCTSSSGKGGWVPETWVELDGSTCILLRDYSAAELTVSRGHLLRVTFVESGWAWATNEQGISGWVPMENLRPAAKEKP